MSSPDSACEFLEEVLGRATYNRLEDGSYCRSIPTCPGVIAFADSHSACERELRSVLEDWMPLALELGHSLPFEFRSGPGDPRGNPG